MSESNIQHELIVFPTELALRHYQQGQALKYGWLDASGHTTFARLQKLCLPYAKLKGQCMNATQQLLMRQQVAEVAKGHFTDGPLSNLSPTALASVLEKLITELASLPKDAQRIINWLLDHNHKQKLHQLGVLASIWRATINSEGLADQLDINRAVLNLLKRGRDNWPPLLQTVKSITFRSVRWFNPFEESCVIALNHNVKINIESALPLAHAELAAHRLGQKICSDIMMEPWAAWAEDLGDAIAVDHPDVLHLDNTDRMDFSRSAGAYGEIEDLARRICWHLESSDVQPNQIALIVPNIGAIQDIIPHVFSRFQIPYYFRRGRPVLSSPCVKAFISWLAVPLRPERDTLIDLIRNPALQFDHREDAVEKLMKAPPRMDLKTTGWFKYLEYCSGNQAIELLNEWIIKPEDHFNSEALKAASMVLETLGDKSMPLRELVSLIEELLNNTTVRPRDSHEQGVWILNPHDAVGLNFELVLFAGLNEGEFPAIPQQDALLGDLERYGLRKHLEERGSYLPKMALADAEVSFVQQSVLFLTALGMAREQVVFSYQSVDVEGNIKTESEYYRKLWNLTEENAEERISPYDQWRMQKLTEGSVLEFKHKQNVKIQGLTPHVGESFLPVVPLPLCRAKDEALQAAVQERQTGKSAAHVEHPEASGQPARTVKHLVDMLEIETERNTFLGTPAKERNPSSYCGYIGALKDRIADWFEAKNELSPTALEKLAQCRYVFLLEQIFGLREPRMADDAPDPMDRGGLIHEIMREIYSSIAQGDLSIDIPRAWAIKTESGWIKRKEGGAEAIPLVVFDPAYENGYIEFARKITLKKMGQIVLGHPGVWDAEQEKVLAMVLNLVRHDIEAGMAENRFPALFEFTFGGDTAVELAGVKIRGKIDRIDLVFADTGTLEKVRVLDYKGSSRARSKREVYIDEVQRNLDCQLPIYAFAAQQYFFGEFNTPNSNAVTDVGYLFYLREIKEVGKTALRSQLPLDEPDLIEEFLFTLNDNLQRLKDGDFAVDPLIKAYNDYSSVCRTEAVSQDELD